MTVLCLMMLQEYSRIPKKLSMIGTFTYPVAPEDSEPVCKAALEKLNL
jgi:hypothetical protein